jgi:catechol-2,3-dioxygenase
MTNGLKSAAKMDLNHLHLQVRHLDRSQRFYESYFRFRKPARHGGILFLRNTSGFDLALAPGKRPVSFPEWFHFGFRLSSAHAVRKLHSRMSSEGMKVSDIEEHADYVTFRCMDPDGYSVEVYWS